MAAAAVSAAATAAPAVVGSAVSAFRSNQKKWLLRWDWLECDGRGVGCRVCREGQLPGPFGCFGLVTASAAQCSHFAKHNASASHKFAAGNWEKVPAEGVFADAMAQNASRAFSLSSKLNKKLLYCLREAMRALDQEAFANAYAMTLLRDERKGRIAIRFRACGLDLQVTSGSLGQERDAGTGALNLVKATARIMQRACTRFQPAPGVDFSATPKVQTFVKKDAFRALRHAVVAIVVDSAGDEMLASEMMRSDRLAASAVALTPNLLHVVRDKAHASRRLLSRPWAADPVLKELCTRTIRGRASIARMVQCSGETRRLFMNFVKTSRMKMLHNTLRNFRAAGHRFESFQKPLGRTCIHLHNVIRTALHLANHRPHHEYGRNAKAWLQWITTERCVLLAMMADASDECLALTRIMDNETVDPASVRREIQTWASKINALFVRGSCVSCFGYTSVMLRTLQYPLVWNIGATCNSVGSDQGVPHQIIDDCLKRMRTWVELATATVLAEFPDFEIAQAPQTIWSAN